MPSLSRAQLLIQQQRFDLAERELRGLLVEDPDQAELHSLLAVCMLQEESRWMEATEEAQIAVGLEPDSPFVHYMLGRVYLVRNRLTEARGAAAEAIGLDPYDADYFGLVAEIELNDRKWQAALDASLSGLSIDAENELCSNIRSIALERLGRSNEALQSARETLSRSPESSLSHVSFGWAALNSGNYKQAQESFREALRLDPTSEPARDGMIYALNNRSFIFRFVYRFYAWIGRFAGKYQFAMIFGAWVVIQILSKLDDANPAMRVVTLPITLAYFLFVLLTWIATPLFNTFLRFHSFGRHLLNRKEIWASNLMAVCIITAFIAGGVTIATSGATGIGVFGYWILMMIPVAATFQQSTPKRTLVFASAATIIALLPVYGIVRCLIEQSPAPMSGVLSMFGWSLLGIQIASGFAASMPVRK